MSNIVPNGADINDINNNVTNSDLSWNNGDDCSGDDIGTLLASSIIVDFSFALKTIELPYDNDDVNDDAATNDGVNDDDGNNWNDNILLQDNNIKNTITIIILLLLKWYMLLLLWILVFELVFFINCLIL